MKEIINPPFLQNIDRWLMLHKPSLWKSNLHYVAFYTLSALIIQTVIALVYPVDFRSMVQVGPIYGSLIIPALICVVLWVIKMVRYNIHHTYVKQSILQEFGVFIINVISLFLITSQLYVMPIIFNWKNADTITQEENLIIDKGLFYLADGMSYRNNYGTRKYNYHTQNYYYEPIREAIYHPESDTYTLSYNSPNRLGNTSLELDTISFIDTIDLPNEESREEINLYYRSTINRKELINHLDQFKNLHNKWYPEAKINLSSEKIISNFIMKKKADTYDSLTTNTYNYEWSTRHGEYYRTSAENIYFINRLIYSVDRAKDWDRDIFDIDFFIRATLWLIIGVSFILWIITLVRWQQIFATVIIMALSPIVIGLISIFLFGFLRLDNDFWAPIFALLIYGFFFRQAIKTNSQDHITPYKNIITIIVTVVLPFVPFATLMWLWHEFIRNLSYYEHGNRLIFGIKYYLFKDYLLIVSESLILVFVFVAIVTFGNILKKQFALPRNN